MKDDLVYIEHIQSSVNRIQSYTSGLNLDLFLENHMVQDAIVRQLEVIGEATKRISQDFRDQHQDIPWKDMAAMRDKLIHHYMGVDLISVWGVISEVLPDLKEKSSLISVEMEA